jgi:hypothetical protein
MIKSFMGKPLYAYINVRPFTDFAGNQRTKQVNRPTTLAFEKRRGVFDVLTVFRRYFYCHNYNILPAQDKKQKNAAERKMIALWRFTIICVR